MLLYIIHFNCDILYTYIYTYTKLVINYFERAIINISVISVVAPTLTI